MDWRCKVNCLMLGAALLMGCETKTSNDRSLDEAEIRSNAKAYSEAFNKKDSDALASFWGQEAIYVNPLTGERAEGRNAIVEAFKHRFTDQEAVKAEITIDSIIFKGPDKAIEKGHVKIFHEDKLEEQTAYQAALIKENGKWLLQQVSEITLEQPPSNYDHLQDLEWMVGDWTDEDDNVDIRINTYWDKHKNFLMQNFSMKVLDQNELQGCQIIGWDPIQEKIRSWVFDSDGGFGEGYWSQQGDSWYVNMSFTLADGRKASSTNIYTKVDGSYTFASEGRDVNGEVLPNIEPVKVVKVTSQQ